jgi:hypothetical protein
MSKVIALGRITRETKGSLTGLASDIDAGQSQKNPFTCKDGNTYIRNASVATTPPNPCN